MTHPHSPFAAQSPEARLHAMRRQILDARSLAAGQAADTPDGRAAADRAKTVFRDAIALLGEIATWRTQATAIADAAGEFVEAHALQLDAGSDDGAAA